MREALAKSDVDFVAYDQPRPARRKSASAKKKRANIFAFVTQKPARTFGFVVASALLVGIGINATLLQTARHPAPFFASITERSVAVKPVAIVSPAVTPIPPQRPVDLASLAPARPVVQNPPRPPAPLGRESEAASPKRDAIAGLLKSDVANEAPSPKIVAAQRALQKVGFVVKPDGVFGATTRQAIERFERDRNLQVTGELAGRTLKMLSMQSGVTIP